ncbi:UvrD-helicase domain-containing protein [Aeromicrobium senzhongii]|uniref:DNA 3'-5' helicase n=1 Tax=Aeromicrobium senzhongii TaxID=2663859 RepID=A0ABX6SQM0_9ACTN|nr:3'-5' exonuclease [Aeromicrobium senzhongii]MTB89050.1 AAA family ATPase [Aeromicrobium senzhongii]QNL93679.1 UvrD-helicase domain-containing protein [Aeromicrobium senzhongii]
MPQIVTTPGAYNIDGSLKSQAFSFLEKLAQDDSNPSLHIEPIMNSADPRVRTGRVNIQFRAVLFKVQGSGQEAHYVFTGIWPHDDAIERAKKVKLKVNPVNGIAEVIEATMPAEARDAADAAAPKVADPDKVPVLVMWGYTLDDLVEGIGIDRHVAHRAMAAVTEDELIDIAGMAVEWQGLALIDLMSGEAIDTVREKYSITVHEPVEEAAAEEHVSDDDLLEAMKHPAARAQFSFIEGEDDLRRVIEEGDFAAWRTFLHPEQRRYVESDYNGPFRLSGGAGTGKTVVLVHRATALQAKDPSAAILLTTFTKTLAESLRSDVKSLEPQTRFAAKPGDRGIHVNGIDAVVHAVISSAVPETRAIAIERVLGPRSGDISNVTDSTRAWSEVIENNPVDLDATLRTSTFLQAEYATVVLPQRITDRDGYFKARRPGRGTALNRSKRAAVWSLVEAYRFWTGIDGSLDFPEKAAVAAAILEQTGPIFDHILVDEGQDLTPSHWQFLRAAARAGKNDLFLAEDAHQRIYGQHVVLGRVGIGIVGRSRRLTLNYRTTAENLRYAVETLTGETFLDAEGEQEESNHYRSARRGPAPRLVATSSLEDELDQAAVVVRAWLDDDKAPETIGILVRDKRQMARVVSALGERGVDVRAVDHKAAGAGAPSVMTMHRAKGMEFSCVLLFGISDDELPARYLLKGLSDTDRGELLQRERSLLYVSATRARDELVVLWAGEPSDMLPRS